MPRPAKGPRLFLRERAGRAPAWVILDTGGVEISTGCGAGEIGAAEGKLAEYLIRKHKSAIGTHNPGMLPIADALSFYADGKAPGENPSASERATFEQMAGYIRNLVLFFGNDTLAQLRAVRCRDYVKWRSHASSPAPEWPAFLPRRVSDQTARRELVVLSAAIGAYHKEYTLDMVPVVTLPEIAPTNRRGLEHSEAAALLAGALGFFRDAESGRVGRRPRSTRTQRKRTARFIILALYSGSRHTAMTEASWLPRMDGPWIDVDRGILHRRGIAEKETDKRRPPAKIPPRLLAHLRRWREEDLQKGQQWVFAVGDRKLAGKIRKGWAGARADGRTLCATLPETATPHWLRHTAGTWLAQGGISTRDGADYLGMSEEVFKRTYYHASPEYQDGIGDAFSESKGRAQAIRKRNEIAPKNAQETPRKR
ncbi:MAG: site-specific integrase [Pseudomonadota bacterium]